MSPPPKHEVTNLVELEERREPLRRGLRIWHLLLPTSGDDLRAYKSLLKYAKPYRGKILLSIALSLLSAIFMGGQLALMNGALVKIFSSASLPPDPPKPSEKQPAAPVDPAPPPASEKSTTPAETEHEKTFVRSVKEWWEEKRTAFENWIYDRFGIQHPPADPGGEHRKTREKSELLNLCALEKSQRAALLWILCGLLVVFTVLASVAKYGQSVIVTGASRRVVRDIRAAVFGHLMSLSVRFHQKNHSAQLVSRITGDLEIFGRFLTEALVRFIQDFLDFAGMLFFITLNGGVFIFVIAGVMGAAIAPVNAIARKLRKSDRHSQAGMAEIAIVITEALTGHRVVKAFASEDREY
ncbi:MAG TPA: ABC transporter transmembrane domain-containing protein, partial [Planctomycetota bacterium]|nr:ABC transporter transmembrane domain-containing protein [Planctomycetota bacterium]